MYAETCRAHEPIGRSVGRSETKPVNWLVPVRSQLGIIGAARASDRFDPVSWLVDFEAVRARARAASAPASAVGMVWEWVLLRLLVVCWFVPLLVQVSLLGPVFMAAAAADAQWRPTEHTGLSPFS